MNKNKIRFITSFVFLTLILMLTTICGAADADTVVVLQIDNPVMLVNNLEKKIDSENGATPVLQNGYTLVPFRAIIESVGGTVDWEGNERKVTASLEGKVVELWLDKNNTKVNGNELTIEIAPTIINGRTMLPLRFVSENLGLNVGWEGSTKTITIKKINEYIATVAGEKVLKSEFKIFLSQVKQEMLEAAGRNSGENPKESFWESTIDGKNAFEVAKNNALIYAKEYKIYTTKAKESGITLNEDELKNIENVFAQFISREGGNVAAEKKITDAYGINLAQYKDFYKNNTLINKYIIETQKNAKIPEEDIKSYYDKNIEMFNQVTVKHILFSTVDESRKPLAEDKQAEAKKKAEEIMNRAKAGEDFASLAKQYTQDPGSKDTGGEYTFGKGEMVKEFEDWSFSAKPGDIGIVKTVYGYHVMKFEKKVTFDDVKDHIKATLAQQLMVNNINQWMNDETYKVVINQDVYNSIK